MKANQAKEIADNVALNYNKNLLDHTLNLVRLYAMQGQTCLFIQYETLLKFNGKFPEGISATESMEFLIKNLKDLGYKTKIDMNNEAELKVSWDD